MKCTKTLSGKHVFWPVSVVLPDLKVWQAHGVDNPLKCIACGVINDLKENERKESKTNAKNG